MRGYATIRMRGFDRRAKQVDQECAKRYLQGRSLVCSVCTIRDNVQAPLLSASRWAAAVAALRRRRLESPRLKLI
jgi:hypothetical protein